MKNPILEAVKELGDVAEDVKDTNCTRLRTSSGSKSPIAIRAKKYRHRKKQQKHARRKNRHAK